MSIVYTVRLSAVALSIVHHPNFNQKHLAVVPALTRTFHQGAASLDLVELSVSKPKLQKCH